MAEETLPAKQMASIKDLIEAAKPRLTAVIPKHLSAERLIRVTLACIARNPALQRCKPMSLLNALMQAAQLGLEPTGVLGSAYLVPFKEDVQLIVGYRGLIDLARRSGQIESIEAHVVHEHDRFLCQYGLEPRLEHEPCWNGDPGPPLAVYAVAKLKDGGRQVEVMTMANIEHVRRSSKVERPDSPWRNHWDEMARKSVVRRLCKYLPLSPEMADAIEIDDEVESERAGRMVQSGLAAILAQAPKAVAREPVVAAAAPEALEAVAAEEGSLEPKGPYTLTPEPELAHEEASEEAAIRKAELVEELQARFHANNSSKAKVIALVRAAVSAAGEAADGLQMTMAGVPDLAALSDKALQIALGAES